MLVPSFVYGRSFVRNCIMFKNIMQCYWWPRTWHCVKNNNELVDTAAFIDSVGILSADLRHKAFAKLCDSLV